MDSRGVVVAEQLTKLLVKWSAGDKEALNDLMPLVYDELRRMAGKYLNRQAPLAVIQPTVIVHEAFIRLFNQDEVDFVNRAQFFGLASRIMRNLMVDFVRAENAAKRGGDNLSVSLSEADRIGSKSEIDLLALDEALDKLAELNPRHGKIVEMRFFGGLTIHETAQVLDLSHATVEREWSLARAWLYLQLK